jgi:hypothetical protein
MRASGFARASLEKAPKIVCRCLLIRLLVLPDSRYWRAFAVA